MAFTFGRGTRASKSTMAYTGSGIRMNPNAVAESVTTSTSSSGSLYAERLKNKLNLGIPGRASRTAASDAASDYVPRMESPLRRGSRMVGEEASGVRRVLGTPGRGDVIASRADYGAVLEARRAQKLASADPGLSTRGVRNAPGRGSRGAVAGGLERRGVRGAPGRGGRAVTGGLEARGVRPTAGERILPKPPARIAGREYGAAERRAGAMARLSAESSGPTREAIAMGGRRNLPAIRGKAVSNALERNSEGAGGVLRNLSKTNEVESVGKKLFEGHGKGIMIGAGIALGAYAYMNRRGKGTSSGRSGMARY